ncbi:conjugal transfer protein TraF (plasmid) [Burkholderia thailandensis]|uniref:conjugal transfer protein TraF n=1 Tax=Burkholderia thailandensis TaxID=57975 RepID=UPI00192DEC1D|nr:conjugal transfer protein TraF [Burkholderia thailandensis]MBS2132331.1 conjugal transfer protein TraF [Burkholderia thailandensis]QRA15138.1 conjugal transfer protein TraF [Burkholderia thailandensis]
MVIAATAALAAAAGYARADGLEYPSAWTCDADKFNWYCDEDASTSAPPAASAPAAANPKNPDDFSQIRTADEMRKALAQRLDVANMDPTPEHIKSYIKLWEYVQEKSAVFADQWRRVVWQDPSLDYSLKRPTNNVAVHSYDDRRNTDQEDQLHALAQKHGLIFFFRSDCQYCHAMAPTMKLIAERYGIEVFPVSLDGRGIPGFPHPAADHGQAATWGVQQVPALYIASKETGDHAMIGSGTLSLQDIIDRIFVLTASQPGELF